MLPQPSVLVVEDSVIIAISMVEALEDAGLAAVHVATLAAARQQLAARRFDVVVLDYRMGNDDSGSLAHDLQVQGIPYVWCSGSMAEDDPATFAGAVVIAKPFSDEQLVSAVSRLAA